VLCAWPQFSRASRPAKPQNAADDPGRAAAPTLPAFGRKWILRPPCAQGFWRAKLPGDGRATARATNWGIIRPELPDLAAGAGTRKKVFFGLADQGARR